MRFQCPSPSNVHVLRCNSSMMRSDQKPEYAENMSNLRANFHHNDHDAVALTRFLRRTGFHFAGKRDIVDPRPHDQGCDAVIAMRGCRSSKKNRNDRTGRITRMFKKLTCCDGPDHRLGHGCGTGAGEIEDRRSCHARRRFDHARRGRLARSRGRHASGRPQGRRPRHRDHHGGDQCQPQLGHSRHPQAGRAGSRAARHRSGLRIRRYRHPRLLQDPAGRNRHQRHLGAPWRRPM